MQAIILAGGKGTRLRPLTQEMPKPMIPVLNKPLMEYSIDLLKKYNITDIGVTLMFLPQYVKNHFKNGEEYGVNISYFTEEAPLGTAGSVKLAEKDLDDTFIVLSGDALTNINIEKILKYHKSINADVTIVLSRQPDPLEYGVVLMDTSGRVISFSEKPQWENVFSDTVNTGIYVIEKKVVEKIPQNTEFDFSKNLFPILLKENYNLFGYISEDYWCDLGNPESYLNSTKDILSGKVFGTKYENILSENVIVSENVKLIPPVYVGKNTVLNGNCIIGPNVTVGEECIIENSKISNSVIWNKNLINRCEFSNLIIGENNKIDSCVFSGNNVVGSNTEINKNVHIKNNLKIYNNVRIPTDSVIEADVYESFSKPDILWGNNGIDGIWNYNITPEILLGIASSYKTDKILVSSNNTALATNLSNLISSYYALCGTTIYKTISNEASCRFFSLINKMKSVYIFEKNEKINIQLIDEKGLNISHNSEKAINFNNKDFSKNRGKIIRLNSIDKDFEYYLNSSIPVCKLNVQINSEEKYRLHNLIWEESDFNGDLCKLSSASILAKNGVITDLYDKDGRLSLSTFLNLKSDVISFLGGGSVFLPSYAPDEIIDSAKNKNLKIYKLMQHRGDSMQQAESFNEISVLVEFVPAFFAQALAFYLSKNGINDKSNLLVARYDFKTLPVDTCKTIFALNKNKIGESISSDYNNGIITIVPKNNGYYFSAYGKFFKEEYAPDIIEHFVSENIK